MLRFYAGTQVLVEWGDAMDAFPAHKDSVYLWEYGSERPEDRWAYYLRLRLFTTDSVGHCAIQLRLNNNRELPDREIAEFCIRVEASQINRLGALSRKFSDLDDEVLYWDLHQSNLYKTQEDAEQALGADLVNSAAQA
jgi:hypothetical protein